MMDKLKLAALVGFTIVGLSMEASAASSVSSAYGQCKVLVKDKMGQETRVSLKKSKKFSKTVTLELAVVPDGESRQRLWCKVDGEALVLMDREGQPIS